MVLNQVKQHSCTKSSVHNFTMGFLYILMQIKTTLAKLNNTYTHTHTHTHAENCLFKYHLLFPSRCTFYVLYHTFPARLKKLHIV